MYALITVMSVLQVRLNLVMKHVKMLMRIVMKLRRGNMLSCQNLVWKEFPEVNAAFNDDIKTGYWSIRRTTYRNDGTIADPD